MIDSDSIVKRNVMTISWLTPVDNNANFICSMNKKRYSAQLVLSSKRFTLSVPTSNMIELILEIGRHSGSNRNKTALNFRSDLSFCKPGDLDNALDFENIDGGYSSDSLQSDSINVRKILKCAQQTKIKL
jgi:hypothetical protein